MTKGLTDIWFSLKTRDSNVRGGQTDVQNDDILPVCSVYQNVSDENTVNLSVGVLICVCVGAGDVLQD